MYCSDCGDPVESRVPKGDNRERYCCTACGMIHYQNPKVIVGALITEESTGRILLCKRAIEPRYGLWTLPAGFLENGETLAQGAIRETMEESGCETQLESLIGVYSIPGINQIYVMFKGVVKSQPATSTEESLEIKLLAPDEIPWDSLAFPVMRDVLQAQLDPRHTPNEALNIRDIYYNHKTREVDITNSLKGLTPLG